MKIEKSDLALSVFPGGRDVRAACLGALTRLPYPVRQGVLGAARMLQPSQIASILPTLYVTARDIRGIGRALLPDPTRALDTPDGLCGLAGDLDTASLVEGYRRGMYVCSHIGPLKWWATRQRMVLFFDDAKVEKGVRRLLRNKRFELTFDRAFDEVVRACARPRPGQTPLTWITPKIRRLFRRAFDDGFAHSVEVWSEGKLVGGVYGLAVGRVFFTESQFHTARDASKVAFAALNRHLQRWGYALNDGKDSTPYLADAGLSLISRAQFAEVVATHAARPPLNARWTIEHDLLNGEWAPAIAEGLRKGEILTAKP